MVPTIRALRDKLTAIGDAEVAKALDTLARKELTAVQQRELLQRTVQLVVNKMLHTPMTTLRAADPDAAARMAAIVCELFDVVPVEGEPRDSAAALAAPEPVVALEQERKAAP